MNKYQEALDNIEDVCHKNSIEEGRVGYDENDINTIQELVDKEKPKKPITASSLKSFGECPKCRSNISIRTAEHYCSKCGQLLEWGEILE